MERVKNRRRRGYTHLSSKHQVTIPASAVAALALEPGDELRVEVDRAGRIVLTRPAGEARREAILAAAGQLTGVWEQGELDRLRDEWR